MEKFFANLFNRGILSFDKLGVSVFKSDGIEFVLKWGDVNKIIILDTFEEYSGYFLTEDYKNKTLYQDISIQCKRNVVRVRTGGTPSVKKNTSDPFSRKFGTTSIYNPIFIEYVDDSGHKNLFASHYNNKKKSETIKRLTSFLSEDKIIKQSKIEGFTPLSEL